MLIRLTDNALTETPLTVIAFVAWSFFTSRSVAPPVAVNVVSEFDAKILAECTVFRSIVDPSAVSNSADVRTVDAAIVAVGYAIVIVDPSGSNPGCGVSVVPAIVKCAAS